MESSSGSMIKLTADNYSIWKTMMEDLLHCKDLYDPVEGASAKPKETSDGDWKKLGRKSIGTIRQWVDISVFHHVAKETDPCELWKKLQELYERKNAQNKAFVIRRLVNLKYKDGSSVAEHLNVFQDLVNQLSTMELVFDDEVQALFLLSSLPDSWETMVVTLSNTAPNGKLTLNIVKESVFNEETRRKQSGASSSQIRAVVGDGDGGSYIGGGEARRRWTAALRGGGNLRRQSVGDGGLWERGLRRGSGEITQEQVLHS